MERTNKSGFDKEWRAAFSGAEVTPPSHIWESLEHQLETGKPGKRKGFLIIPWLVAAMIAFAMTVGGVLYLNQGDTVTHSPVIADNQAVNKDENENIKGDSREIADPATQEESSGTQHASRESQKSTEHTNINTLSESGTDIPTGTDTPNGNDTPTGTNPEQNILREHATQARKPIMLSENERLTQNFADRQKSAMISAVEGLEPFELKVNLSFEPAKMQGVPYYASGNRSGNKNNTIWASIGVSAGAYSGASATQGDQNYSNYSFATSEAGSVRAFTEQQSSGQVVNFGANVGSRLGERWVLQGGIGYLERSSGGESNVVDPSGGKENIVSALTDALETQRSFKTTDQYSFQDIYQVITVPVQVGYIVLDRKIGITLLSGLSNDLLIQRKLQAENASITDITIRPADSKDYNSYGVSALVTTEVSYSLGENYAVTLFPQVRQSLRPLTTQEVQRDAEKSLVWEIGFRFRYLIR